MTSNYDRFRLQSPASDEQIDAILAQQQLYYTPTGAEHKNGDEQYVPVLKTSPFNLPVSPKTLVRLMAWSDDIIRPETKYFDAYLAEELGADVLSVGMPGISHKDWANPDYEIQQQLTPGQREDLQDGSFRKVGQALLHAAIYAEEVLRSDERSEEPAQFIVVSSSMAAATAAGVIGAAADNGYEKYIAGAAFGEGVNYQPRSLGGLALRFCRQSGEKESLAQNPQRLQDANEGVKHWAGRVVESRSANIAYFKALTKGRFEEDLGDMDALSKSGLDIPVIVHSGDKSSLSPLGHNMHIKTQLDKANVRAEQWLYEGVDHPYTMTLGSVAHSARQLL